ncbi:MAG: hypothetical protein ACRD2F_15290, partial [Terriglobales bacterium]
MKMTHKLLHDVLTCAKRAALECGWTLRRLVEVALRREITARPKRRRQADWVTTPGGLPADLDLSDREQMRAW